MLSDLFEILHIINESVSSGRSEQLSQSDKLISTALFEIHSRLHELRSTNELAASLFVSREYLSRRFSRTMGISLNKYITLKRVEKAKEMLRSGAGNLEICEKCGFSDESYFIYVFRRETGTTPHRFKLREG